MHIFFIHLLQYKLNKIIVSPFSLIINKLKVKLFNDFSFLLVAISPDTFSLKDLKSYKNKFIVSVWMNVFFELLKNDFINFSFA